MRVTCTRRLEFDAAHRLMKHESKCSVLHGHRYVAEIECSAESLDSVGRVIDFACVKREVGEWIDFFWDHTAILHQEDAVLIEAHCALSPQKPPFLLDVEPTAENIAAVLYRRSAELLRPHGVEVVRVRLYETPNCFAEVTG